MVGKIVHLIGQMGRGGAEGQLVYLADALHRRGWPQCVISFNPGGVWEDRLRQAEIPVLGIPRSSVKPWRLGRLRTLVRQQEPRILLAWSTHVAVYGRWLRGVGNPARIFNLRQDLTTNSHTGKPVWRRCRCRGTLERADFVVSNSRRNLQVLRQRGVKLPPAQVIYNMVTIRGRAKPAQPAAVGRIVAAGSLRPLKAHDVLLQAAARLAAEGAEFELLLVGDGPRRGALQDLARRLHLADRVKFLGEVGDVPGLLADAHILAHPSKSEGLSNTVLEAMAEGLPVVASRVGGIPEMIRHGRTGLLVPPGRTEPLAAALRRLLAEPALRGQLGNAALQHLRQHCDARVIVDRYEEVFRRLWRRRGGRRGCA